MFFHNFTGYDNHLFVRVLKRFKGDIKVIACNDEKHVSVAKEIPMAPKVKWSLRFLDSAQFMPGSLSSHVKNLKSVGKDSFKYVMEHFPGEQLNMLLRKGVEVDLNYPRELHDKFAEYVPVPDNIVPEGSKVGKLAPNLLRKERYVCHVKNLRLYAKHCVMMEKVHRGVSFDQSTFLAPYIRKNTDLRMQAKNDFEKDFFKLLNNSVFGKSCENLFNRVDVRLVGERKKAVKLVAKPTYKHHTIYDENLVGVHLRVSKVRLNKPSYLRIAVLDLSKTLMYELHYNYIKPKYGDNARLLFTDTDSLCYHINTEDFYKDIANDVSEWFDTSAYPRNHPSGIPTGMKKKVIGMFKDESNGEQIHEFAGVRAKCYAVKYQDKEDKKCKGVKKAVVKKRITFEDYKNCVLNKAQKFITQNMIRSRAHNVFTESLHKRALSAEDDKRVVLEDGINTLPIGQCNKWDASQASFKLTAIYSTKTSTFERGF